MKNHPICRLNVGTSPAYNCVICSFAYRLAFYQLHWCKHDVCTVTTSPRKGRAVRSVITGPGSPTVIKPEPQLLNIADMEAEEDDIEEEEEDEEEEEESFEDIEAIRDKKFSFVFEKINR